MMAMSSIPLPTPPSTQAAPSTPPLPETRMDHESRLRPTRSHQTTYTDLPRERHPEFYFMDGAVTFLVPEPTRETLYRLYPGLLAKHSAVFETMLSLPQGQQLEACQQNAEGHCDENPIVLHGIVRWEFDHLLTFLFGWYSGEPQRQDFLISVLKLSDFYQIDRGFQYALAELKRLSPFDVALKLELERQFHVHEWVEPSFRAMVERPVSSISRIEARRMGMENFWILTTTKAKIEEHYRALAYTQPMLVRSPECKTPLACAAAWKEEWWNGIARHFLHPEPPCRSHGGILVLLQETNFDGGICASCKAGILSKLESSAALRYEEDMQDIAAVLVMEAQMDGHV
ncbi:hypothetical protein EV363DRAFT_1454488 [Boletus edulis]|nr:hypothetical protein EV363DRAFT_1454488 [Boletus edulis]